MTTLDNAEAKAWRDAYGIAVVGASNTAAVARTIAETISALRQSPASQWLDNDTHPAVRAMVAHLAYLTGQGLGPTIEDLRAVIDQHESAPLGWWVGQSVPTV
jgi:hypothetical protein